MVSNSIAFTTLLALASVINAQPVNEPAVDERDLTDLSDYEGPYPIPDVDASASLGVHASAGVEVGEDKREFVFKRAESSNSSSNSSSSSAEAAGSQSNVPYYVMALLPLAGLI